MRRIGVFGSELALLLDFGPIERMYIRCFGSLSTYTVQRYLQFKYFPMKSFREMKIGHKRILDFGRAFEGDFSFTILTDVLEHIEDDYRVLKEIYVRTVTGGYLYVSVPLYRGEHLSEDDVYHGHMRTGYRTEEIQNLLEQADHTAVR